MLQLPSFLSKDHERLLAWFRDHAGEMVPFSALRETTPMLVHKALGIWRPGGWDYALSIKQTITSPYLDSSVVNLPNGDWVYRYHRESGSAGAPHRNQGLLNCMKDDVPVGVLIQHLPKPNTTYWVGGLGRITWFDGEFFTLEQWGRVSDGAELYDDLEAENYHMVAEDFDPDAYDSERDVRLRALAVRHGQGLFRAQVLMAYDRRCAISGSSAVPALDAAHIHPYGGRATNNITNGLLLRTDIHKLFDLGLIAVDTRSMTQILSPVLQGTEYEEFHGRPLLLPRHPSLQPSTKSLDQHRDEARL